MRRPIERGPGGHDAGLPAPDARLAVLVLPRYGTLGASSRLRMHQYLALLGSMGFDCWVFPLVRDRMLGDRYRRSRYGFIGLLGAYLRRIRVLSRARRYDLVWIEKEALPWFPAWTERLLLRKVAYAVDIDDAVFHQYDMHPIRWVRHFMGRRLDRTMARASVVVAGNSYLAARASTAGARRVVIVPTVVDLDRYPTMTRERSSAPLRIVWIGSPTTSHYLRIIEEPLARLARRHRFRLRVIGAEDFRMSGVEVEAMPWSRNSEVARLQECHIGVMPLHSSPWELGKCGYKLVQYMACKLPVVASRVGANVDIVAHGETGFLANDGAEWLSMLETLLSDPGARERMGRAGREIVEIRYSTAAQAGRLGSLLREAASTTCAG